MNNQIIMLAESKELINTGKYENALLIINRLIDLNLSEEQELEVLTLKSRVYLWLCKIDELVDTLFIIKQKFNFNKNEVIFILRHLAELNRISPIQSSKFTLISSDPQFLKATRQESQYSIFESIGNNCEFGALQSWFGLEPLHLFRWGSANVSHLTELIANDFSGFSQSKTSQLLPTDPNIPVGKMDFWCAKYNIRFHTMLAVENLQSIEPLKERFIARLHFLLGRFREDCAANKTIKVFKQDGLTADDAKNLYLSLSNLGKTRLLVVTSNKLINVPMVSMLNPGLYFGELSSFNYFIDDNRVSMWKELLDQVLIFERLGTQ